MMRSCVLLVLLLLCVALPAYAQDYTRTEWYIGYSYAYDGAGKFTRENAGGWTANYTRNFSRHFGLTTDAGAFYGNVKDLAQLLAGPTPTVASFPGVNFQSYQFMLGPRINFRRRWLSPFIQALVGVAITTQQSTSLILVPGQPCPFTVAPGQSCSIPNKIDYSTAVGGGIGLDLNLIRNFGLRLAEADLVPVRAQRPDGSQYWQRNIRARAGLVFKW